MTFLLVVEQVALAISFLTSSSSGAATRISVAAFGLARNGETSPPTDCQDLNSGPSVRVVVARSVDRVGLAHTDVLVGIVDSVDLCDRRAAGAVEVVVVEEVEPAEALTGSVDRTLSNSGANTRSFHGVGAGTHSATCPVLVARGFSTRTLRRTEATVS